MVANRVVGLSCARHFTSVEDCRNRSTEGTQIIECGLLGARSIDAEGRGCVADKSKATLVSQFRQERK